LVKGITAVAANKQLK